MPNFVPSCPEGDRGSDGVVGSAKIVKKLQILFGLCGHRDLDVMMLKRKPLLDQLVPVEQTFSPGRLIAPHDNGLSWVMIAVAALLFSVNPHDRMLTRPLFLQETSCQQASRAQTCCL